jgi:hypothetical protein
MNTSSHVCIVRFREFYMSTKIELKIKLYFDRCNSFTRTKIPLLQVPRICFTMFTQSEKDSIQLPLPFPDPHIQFPNQSYAVTFRIESTIEFIFFQSLLFSHFFPKASCNMNHPPYLLRQNAAMHETKRC